MREKAVEKNGFLPDRKREFDSRLYATAGLQRMIPQPVPQHTVWLGDLCNDPRTGEGAGDG